MSHQLQHLERTPDDYFKMSELINEKDRFQVKINVEHFKIENVTVISRLKNEIFPRCLIIGQYFSGESHRQKPGNRGLSRRRKRGIRFG